MSLPSPVRAGADGAPPPGEARGRLLNRRTALAGAIGAAIAVAAPRAAQAADPTLSNPNDVTLAPPASDRNIIQPTDPSVLPLSVRGAAGQTADLQQWQDSAGNVLAGLAGDGSLFRVPSLRVKASSGQSADLQQWQDPSGNVLSALGIDGSLRLPSLRLQAVSGQTAPLQQWLDSSGNTLGLLASDGSSFRSGPLTVRALPGQTADLQQWQDASGNVLASFASNPTDGARLSLPTPTGKPFRLNAWEQTSPDSLIDRIFTLTYNRYKQGLTWFRDDPTREAVGFQLESWWNGNVEINLDLQAPNGVEHRALGLAARYDGSQLVFGIGTSMYASGAGGIQLCGGTIADHRQLRIYERTGAKNSETIFTIVRPDNSSSFAWRGGGMPRLLFPLAGANAVAMGNYGIMKFAGQFDAGEPVLHFGGVGTGCLLFNSQPVTTDVQSRFRIWGDGKHEWGGGAAVPDANLYRAAAGVLKTDNQFRATDGLVGKLKFGAPSDADFAAPVDGVLAVDTLNNKLWTRIGGVWKSIQLS